MTIVDNQKMDLKSEKGILGVILASATLTVMAGALIAPVIRAMIDPLEAPIALIGLVITTHGLFAVIFSPVMGYLIDRVGRKPIYAFGLFIYGLGGGSGFFISSFLLMLVSRAFLGIGVAAVVINHQPSEHANESVNASEHKSTKHEKPVGFGTKIVAFTSDKYKEKVDEKIAEKIAEKTDRAKIAIAIANATSVDQTEIKIGARVIAKINGSEINVTDVTP